MSKVTDHYTHMTAHFWQPSRTHDHQPHPVPLEEALQSTEVVAPERVMSCRKLARVWT